MKTKPLNEACPAGAALGAGCPVTNMQDATGLGGHWKMKLGPSLTKIEQQIAKVKLEATQIPAVFTHASHISYKCCFYPCF